MSTKPFAGAIEKIKKPDDMLENSNYFNWEFNMKLTLARKGF